MKCLQKQSTSLWQPHPDLQQGYHKCAEDLLEHLGSEELFRIILGIGTWPGRSMRKSTQAFDEMIRELPLNLKNL